MADPGTGSRLVRAAAVGLALALLVGGVGLAVAALTRRVDCAGLSPQACALEEDVAAAVRRTQGLSAVALVGLALGLSLLLRGPRAGR